MEKREKYQQSNSAGTEEEQQARLAAFEEWLEAQH
jgi:hypothetical protein